MSGGSDFFDLQRYGTIQTPQQNHNSSLLNTSGKSLKIKHSGITFGRRKPSECQSFNSSQGDTSAYDLLQLMAKPELKAEPQLKFVNLKSLQQEQEKRTKLRNLLEEQSVKNEKLTADVEELT